MLIFSSYGAIRRHTQNVFDERKKLNPDLTRGLELFLKNFTINCNKKNCRKINELVFIKEKYIKKINGEILLHQKIMMQLNIYLIVRHAYVIFDA